ncbi:MAG TPA: molybdopterin molybdenumtransferase MoeA, partial [Noviherbaspirillum sp.]|nr:molybdopterin molybdenumtransferase MoeA [Noviherbaspirillum sp.]
LQGAAGWKEPRLRAILQNTIRRKPGRTEFLRGVLSGDLESGLQVRLTGAQGSGILSSMAQANCIVVLAPERGEVAAGEPVEVVLLD